MNKLTIKDGRIYLDGKRIEGVTGYSVKSSANRKYAELNLRLIVSMVEIEPLLAPKSQM